MDYRMPSPTSLFGRDNAVKCCRKAIWTIYGVSEYEWRVASSRLKEVASGENVLSLHHKSFTDDRTLHDYTYKEAEQVFNDNLRYAGSSFTNLLYILLLLSTIIVKYLLHILDSSMVRNSLVP